MLKIKHKKHRPQQYHIVIVLRNKTKKTIINQEEEHSDPRKMIITTKTQLNREASIPDVANQLGGKLIGKILILIV